MENANQRAQIINELLQGLESTKELRNEITNKTTSLCDHQALHYYTSLIETVMSTFNKTITIAKQINNNDNAHLELPHSIADSSPIIHKPRPDFRAHKRRKMMPKSTKIVHVSHEKSIRGLEGPLHDGFSWRKYGQKEILGAKFPRGYYRCTHRHSRACLATKQVQRSDQDPSILRVMYKGEHTCHTKPQPDKAQSKSNPAHIMETEPQPPLSPNQHLMAHPTIQELLLGLGPEGDLTIEPNNRTRIFRCFSFNSALLETEQVDNYILDCSLDFASPSISGNYFPSSPCGNSMPQVEFSVRTSGSDMKDPISGRNSVTNSPIDVFELPLERWPDLDPNFF